jgi:hypothetical protein
MSPYARIRDKSHRKRRRKRTAETGWGTAAGHRPRSWFWLVSGLILIGGTVVYLLHDRNRPEAVAAVPLEAATDEVANSLHAAEVVARAFLAEADPAKRLQWVRNAEEVKSRLAEYPDEARTGMGEIESVVGHRVDDQRPVSAFVVEFPSGNLRLLEVVGTAEGPRVDWDAYARYGTADWSGLWSGTAGRALVRVFCEPATERPEPFEDQARWTCFRMSSPDMPQAALGFAAAGTVREEMMKRVVLGTPNYRQRFTLEIVRHDGKDEPLFEISRCLAVGWILDDRDIEDLWMER